MKRGSASLAAARSCCFAATARRSSFGRRSDRVDFDLRGRMAARYGDDSFTGNVSWRHAHGGDEMLITTPLGQGVARIVRAGEAVQLTTADGKEHRRPTAEALTERCSGSALPLERPCRLGPGALPHARDRRAAAGR